LCVFPIPIPQRYFFSCAFGLWLIIHKRPPGKAFVAFVAFMNETARSTSNLCVWLWPIHFRPHFLPSGWSAWISVRFLEKGYYPAPAFVVALIFTPAESQCRDSLALYVAFRSSFHFPGDELWHLRWQFPGIW